MKDELPDLTPYLSKKGGNSQGKGSDNPAGKADLSSKLSALVKKTGTFNAVSDEAIAQSQANAKTGDLLSDDSEPTSSPINSQTAAPPSSAPSAAASASPAPSPASSSWASIGSETAQATPTGADRVENKSPGQAESPVASSSSSSSWEQIDSFSATARKDIANESEFLSPSSPSVVAANFEQEMESSNNSGNYSASGTFSTRPVNKPAAGPGFDKFKAPQARPMNTLSSGISPVLKTPPKETGRTPAPYGFTQDAKPASRPAPSGGANSAPNSSSISGSFSSSSISSSTNVAGSDSASISNPSQARPSVEARRADPPPSWPAQPTSPPRVTEKAQEPVKAPPSEIPRTVPSAASPKESEAQILARAFQEEARALEASRPDTSLLEDDLLEPAAQITDATSLGALFAQEKEAEESLSAAASAAASSSSSSTAPAASENLSKYADAEPLSPYMTDEPPKRSLGFGNLLASAPPGGSDDKSEHSTLADLMVPTGEHQTLFAPDRRTDDISPFDEIEAEISGVQAPHVVSEPSTAPAFSSLFSTEIVTTGHDFGHIQSGDAASGENAQQGDTEQEEPRMASKSDVISKLLEAVNQPAVDAGANSQNSEATATAFPENNYSGESFAAGNFAQQDYSNSDFAKDFPTSDFSNSGFSGSDFNKDNFSNFDDPSGGASVEAPAPALSADSVVNNAVENNFADNSFTNDNFAEGSFAKSDFAESKFEDSNFEADFDPLDDMRTADTMFGSGGSDKGSKEELAAADAVFGAVGELGSEMARASEATKADDKPKEHIPVLDIDALPMAFGDATNFEQMRLEDIKIGKRAAKMKAAEEAKAAAAKKAADDEANKPKLSLTEMIEQANAAKLEQVNVPKEVRGAKSSLSSLLSGADDTDDAQTSPAPTSAQSLSSGELGDSPDDDDDDEDSLGGAISDALDKLLAEAPDQAAAKNDQNSSIVSGGLAKLLSDKPAQADLSSAAGGAAQSSMDRVPSAADEPMTNTQANKVDALSRLLEVASKAPHKPSEEKRKASESASRLAAEINKPPGKISRQVDVLNGPNSNQGNKAEQMPSPYGGASPFTSPFTSPSNTQNRQAMQSESLPTNPYASPSEVAQATVSNDAVSARIAALNRKLEEGNRPPTASAMNLEAMVQSQTQSGTATVGTGTGSSPSVNSLSQLPSQVDDSPSTRAELVNRILGSAKISQHGTTMPDAARTVAENVSPEQVAAIRTAKGAKPAQAAPNRARARVSRMPGFDPRPLIAIVIVLAVLGGGGFYAIHSGIIKLNLPSLKSGGDAKLTVDQMIKSGDLDRAREVLEGKSKSGKITSSEAEKLYGIYYTQADKMDGDDSSEALKLLEKIPSKSKKYKDAQKLVRKLKKKVKKN